MIIPIGDTPNPPGTPVVNYLLIAVNVAVFLLVTLPLSMTSPDLNDPAVMEYVRSIPQFRGYPIGAVLQGISAYDIFLFKNAFRPAEPGLMSLFISMFLHGGWMHLIGNLLFLWIYGDNVEMRLGRLRYLAAYLGTGAAATIFYSFFSPNSTTPMIGASGAISGMLGFYFLWFPRNKVKIMFLLFPFFMDVILVPARIVLGFYLIIENFLPFVFTTQSGGGVAYGAHIGGFVAGLAVAYGLNRFPDLLDRASWKEEEEQAPEEGVFRPEERHPSPVEMMEQEVRDGNMSRAARYYFAMGSARERRMASPDDLMRIGDYLLNRKLYDHALTLFRRYISERPSGPYLDWAYLGAGMSLLFGNGQNAAAYQYFLQVLDVNPSEKAGAEAKRLIRAIEETDRHRRRGSKG